MVKTDVLVKKYADGRINQLTINGRNKIQIQFIYDAEKSVRQFQIDGKKPLILSDTLAMVNLAQVIDKEPLVFPLMHVITPSILINRGFEDDFAGWENVSCSISAAIFYEGVQSLKFGGLLSYVGQAVPSLFLGYVRALTLRMRTDALANTLWCSLRYVDGSKTDTPLKCNVINTWELKEIGFVSSKTLNHVYISQVLEATTNVWIDDIKVFI